MFGQFGPGEIAIVLLLALVLFGPKKLPEMGRSLGKGLREFKSGISGDHDTSMHSEAVAPEQPQLPAALPPAAPPPAAVNVSGDAAAGTHR